MYLKSLLRAYQSDSPCFLLKMTQCARQRPQTEEHSDKDAVDFTNGMVPIYAFW